MKRRNRRGRLTFLAETVNMAMRAMTSNKLRSWLTISVIALGITSLVGILTAVEALRSSVNETYSRFGAGAITISQSYNISSDRKRIKNPRYISMAQARLFKENYDVPATVSIHAFAASDIRVEAGGRRTNPNIDVIGGDENLLAFKHFNISQGRDFIPDDINGGRFYCIIGDNIARTLYPDRNAVGNPVFIKGHRYTVIGVVEKMGNAAGGSVDNQIMIPYTNASANLAQSQLYYNIGILPAAGVDESIAASEARKVFRAARRLAPYDEDDFDIRRRETEIREQNESLSAITAIAITIGLITLTGAAVGLMNIMLVSVKERTREIGTRKAIGASSSRIKLQFLLESILIGETGGVIGIVAGIIAGNITAAFMEADFVIPWGWMVSAIILCIIVGIMSGYLPAQKAASLDPIECLRHE